MNIQNHNSKKGFTIIEMLVAVFIFTVAISALTLMAGRGIKSANNSQQRITAEFLAVEAMEVVRNVRDSAFISSGATGINNVFDTSGCLNSDADNTTNVSCSFQYSGSGVPSLQVCDSCDVYLGSTGYTYTNSSSQTPYVRKIYLYRITQNEIRVHVVVQWNDEEIEYYQNLFLWG